MAGRLGELLVRENLISLQQLQRAQDEQKKAGGRIGYHLTKLGFIEESELTNFLSKQYGVPSINLKEFDIDGEVVKLVPKEVAEKHQCIPVNRAGASLILAMSCRLKIRAELDIAERRLPQDGRIKHKLGKGREMDFRVSVCPTPFGEKVVLRLRDKSNLQLDRPKLGFDPDPLNAFKEAID